MLSVRKSIENMSVSASESELLETHRKLSPRLVLCNLEPADDDVAHAAAETTTRVESKFLKFQTLSPALLAQLDGAMLDHRMSMLTGQDEALRAIVIQNIENELRLNKSLTNLAVELVGLASKESTKPSELWPICVSRTDGIYFAAEQLLPVFRECCHGLVQAVGLDLKATKQHLRSPMQMLDKVTASHGDACVGEIICPSISIMCMLQKKLLQGYTHNVDGHIAEMKVARLVNTFNERDLGPTRYRSIVNTVRLQHKDSSIFVELRVHHEKIHEYNGSSHADDELKFFGESLELSNELETIMKTFGTGSPPRATHARAAVRVSYQCESLPRLPRAQRKSARTRGSCRCLPLFSALKRRTPTTGC